MIGSRRLALLILAVVLVVVGGLLLALRLRRGSARAVVLAPLRPLQVVPGAAPPVVEQGGGSQLLLQTASGARRVTLPAGLPIEVLRRAPALGIQAGDWLSIGGAANQINSFALKKVVLIPAGEASSNTAPNQPPRSKDGFTGFEGEQDPKIGPALYGRVRAIAGATVTLDAPAGAVTLQLPPQTSILRLQAGDAAQIHDGDRLIFAGSTDPAAATAVLAR